MRHAHAYARRGPVREPYDTVLIVCEGGKSEPNYLRRLAAVHRLSSANITITPADGSDPMSVVSFAERELARNDYDRVFCVFDRNGHANYDEALTKIDRLNKFTAVTSWPCFEVWVLLHFTYSSAPYQASGGDSACGKVVKAVKLFISTYTKGYASLFDDLEDRLKDALRHAETLQRENIKTGSTNPATRVHELVKYLIALRK